MGESAAVTDVEDIVLRNIFYDTSHPAGYSTARRLSEATHLPLDKVQSWLQAEEPYTLHRPKRKRFPRGHYKVFFPDELWQADLVDMSAFQKDNDHVRYLLTVVDVFSKMAFVQPLKSKTGPSVTQAFKTILHTSSRRPQYLQTDKGTEFLNSPFQRMLRQEGIRYYHSNDPVLKCSVVERFNRTLKQRMWAFFTHTSSHRFVDELQRLVQGYNATRHSTIKMAPKDVNDKTMAQVYHHLKAKWAKQDADTPTTTFKVGDHVRISLDKGPFAKSYEENWSQEVFKIRRVLPRKPVVYELEDLAGEVLQGTFYRWEVQKVKIPDVYKVEKVLRTQKRKGKTWYLVKFRGYPDKFNQWVDHLVDLV